MITLKYEIPQKTKLFAALDSPSTALRLNEEMQQGVRYAIMERSHSELTVKVIC